jgi:hypothetical protein
MVRKRVKYWFNTTTSCCTLVANLLLLLLEITRTSMQAASARDHDDEHGELWS